MHNSAMKAGEAFFQCYWRDGFHDILDLGGIDLNGTLREFQPEGSNYVGLDIEAGPGVDVVLDKPGAAFPFADDSFDVVVTTSCFEHDQMFWYSFCEMLRVTRPGGFVYINAPSNGKYHSHPYDNWRFFPDAVLALIAWAEKQGMSPALVESLTLRKMGDLWNDYLMVVTPDAGTFNPPLELLSDRFPKSLNIRRHDSDEVVNFSPQTDDMKTIRQLRAKLAKAEAEIERLKAAQTGA